MIVIEMNPSIFLAKMRLQKGKSISMRAESGQDPPSELFTKKL
jgi:hypothetical protein